MDEPRDPIRLDPDAIDASPEATPVEEDVESVEDVPLTRDELARELVELLDDLASHEMRELVDKNVPPGALEFFARYAEDFSRGLAIESTTARRLPNLMVLGYLLRLLEDRLIEDPEEIEA